MMMTTMTMKMRWRAGAALAAVLAALVPGRAQAQRPDVAVVYRLLQEGRMIVLPGGGTEGRPAALGERLRDRDRVRTSENTRAALRFTDDGSILRVNPNSMVLLTSGDERGVVVRTLQLEFGELWTRVARHEGTTLRVGTPAGVAAVKGTEFVVRVDSASGATTVLTLEGVVEFFNDAGRVDLPAGQKVVATSRTEAPRAEPATREELRAAEGARGDEGGAEEGTWVTVELQDNAGRTRTLMLRLPAAAVRARVEAP
jgi:hypothetical protein